MMNEIKEHEQFIKHVKKYINECLTNGSTPEIVLGSFKKLIDEVIKEHETQA